MQMKLRDKKIKTSRTIFDRIYDFSSGKGNSEELGVIHFIFYFYFFKGKLEVLEI